MTVIATRIQPARLISPLRFKVLELFATMYSYKRQALIVQRHEGGRGGE